MAYEAIQRFTTSVLLRSMEVTRKSYAVVNFEKVETFAKLHPRTVDFAELDTH